MGSVISTDVPGGRDTQKTQHGIETYLRDLECTETNGRDTQKTQHGIETTPVAQSGAVLRVETLRKPSTGLKHDTGERARAGTGGRDTQKTQHGIETAR